MATERPKAKPRVVNKIWNVAKSRPKEAPKKNPVDGVKIRVHSDLASIDAPTAARLPLEFPDPDNILKMTLSLTPHIDPDSPKTAYYVGGVFHFDIDIPHEYPHAPPKVRCTEKIYHPNVDLDGNVCLELLRKSWTSTTDLSAIILALEQIFVKLTDDDTKDPLNLEAAADYNKDRDTFRRNVRKAMGGGTINGHTYDRVMKK